jgi:hypothetical protein
VTLSTGPSPRVRGKRWSSAPTGQRSPGHPRACWENVRRDPDCEIAGRAIPARAGKTRRAWPPGTLQAGHPRACGENGALGHKVERCARAIPARAGKTLQELVPANRTIGPSPRVRGKLHLLDAIQGDAPGHPRACGENDAGVPAAAHDARAIPARAGKTPQPPMRGLARPGHPRACGENANPRGSVRAAFGPSPRVRGKRGLGDGSEQSWPGHPRACGENDGGLDSGRGLFRAIPARAGKTPLPFGARAVLIGPSPRVRGKHLEKTRFSEVREVRSLFRHLQYVSTGEALEALHSFAPRGVPNSDHRKPLQIHELAVDKTMDA